MTYSSVKYPFALDEENKMTNIIDAKRKMVFSCVFCGCRMIAKKGKINAHHFAHVGLCTESWKYDTMTQWHKNWQNIFPNNNREVILIKNDKKHIADIWFNDYIIEFQHSKIEIEEFLDRNRFYTSFGYKLIWIFDFINGKNIKNIELLCEMFKYEKEDIYIFKEVNNNVLISADDNYKIDKNQFIEEILNSLFPNDRSPFNKEKYLEHLKKTKHIEIQKKEKLVNNSLNIELNSSIHNLNKRDIPKKNDRIIINEYDNLKEIIEKNRGKDFWLICKNTDTLYYFENTYDDNDIKVWVKTGPRSTELDKVYSWETLKSFINYKWKTYNT